MKISVVGAGYVGLVTAACFADLGHQVINIDSDRRKIALLKKGKPHFYEPGLEELILTNVQKGRLSFGTDVRKGAAQSEVVIIAVGTPPRPDGGADLSAIEAVARDVAATLTAKHKLIIEKSTVPVRTGLKIRETIRRYAPKNAQFDVASNPEFLREGTAIHDFMNPDRIIVGADTARAKEVLNLLYQSIKAPLVMTDLNSAEIIKHASNSFLAMKISFINAVSRICELSGADIQMVSHGMGLDSRIGKKFLNAGIGFGGFCFPKDLGAFVHISESLGYDFKLLKAVQEINESQVKHYLNKIEEKLWNVRGKRVAVWGLAFKPNTDDMRYAPSVEIINFLTERGTKVIAFDPKAMEKAKEVLPKKSVTYAKNAYEACRAADCLLIVTEWNEFKEADMKRVKKLMRHPLVIDGRNLYEPDTMKDLGIQYVSMGR
jgi:UDPglucose 6-dehydrogenase